MTSELDPTDVIRLDPESVCMLDQRELPGKEVELVCVSAAEVAEAIQSLAIRGAPAIGIAAAMGFALAAIKGEDMNEAEDVLVSSRITAVNLQWALREVKRDGLHPADLARNARRIHAEEVSRCKQMSQNASVRFSNEAIVLTHCNTGSLATGGHGTALGAIKTAHSQGKIKHIYVNETRPLLQGSRLTAWELERAQIPYSVIVDGAAAATISRCGITNVVVGADRIASNGDTANKIGTYGLAVICKQHSIPFDVVAPTSTIDRKSLTGMEIPIEERLSTEVTENFPVFNPAFDVTPAELISAIVTEQGVHCAPFQKSLPGMVFDL